MFNTKIISLEIPALKIISYSKFRDTRGYFTENFKKTDLANLPGLKVYKDLEISQINESFSYKDTVRGLHFQWNPVMYKLFKPVFGSVITVAVDIRKGSPTYGKACARKLSSETPDENSQVIYIPEGFALGFLALEDTLVQYLLTGVYNEDCEAAISPTAKDINWSLVENSLKNEFLNIAKITDLISEKDKGAMTFSEWSKDSRSENFIYEE